MIDGTPQETGTYQQRAVRETERGKINSTQKILLNLIGQIITSSDDSLFLNSSDRIY